MIECNQTQIINNMVFTQQCGYIEEPLIYISLPERIFIAFIIMLFLITFIPMIKREMKKALKEKKKDEF